MGDDMEMEKEGRPGTYAPSCVGGHSSPPATK
jgi:hypothetical protein